ncbi:MAG: helix-turn-helix transcriptional regulator [Bacillota bacterium]|nr:helix-turn-helix transcriptional regulator [Bacillota bacterium]
MSERVRLALEMAGLDADEAARMAGMDAGRLRAIEEGRLAPSSDEVLALAAATGLPFDWFFRPGRPPEVRLVRACRDGRCFNAGGEGG